MQDFVKSVSGEVNLPLVPDEQLDFTMKLYDLNQVGHPTLQWKIVSQCTDTGSRLPSSAGGSLVDQVVC